ncbi:hypothetical protein [Paenibacillus sp. NEAU-GSW1]|uniref:hypothetical protein n=1 Tax=Paenibacillus sp. NEAU-GSW1 TaxID=2682486 RepID=UPI0012E145B7|nr:hypothetical protein [Paenibacillus sp. NEAU-GSW1]MUT64882.1 hypothetical protein [Paenibacillus sp. NEAU-GSW1]
MTRELERMKKTIIKLLLHSDNRTTDFLETVVNDCLHPIVIEQKLKDNSANDERAIIVRESVLIAEKSKTTISHNIALVYPDAIPLELYSKLLHKKEGIGKVIRTLGLSCSRHIRESGWRRNEEIINLFGESMTLSFDEKGMIPYKEYTIHFDGFSSVGIHLIEYFNPAMFQIDVPVKHLSI